LVKEWLYVYAILFELTLFIDLRGLPGGGKGAVLDYLPGLERPV